MDAILQAIKSNPYYLPGAIILCGILLGWFFQKVVKVKLKKISEKTAWQGDDIIIQGIGQAPVLWFLLLGFYAASFSLPFIDGYEDLVREGLFVVFVISLSVVCSRISVLFIHAHARKQKGLLQSTSMFSALTRLVIYLLGTLVVLQTFNISILPFITALGVGGLAVALALQETLTNLFAGLHIIATRKLHPGDFVELDSGQSGFIQDISWRNTTIQTLSNNLIVVPNAKMASAILTNYTRPQNEMSVLVAVSVSYDSDLGHVEKVVNDVASEILKKVTGGVPTFEPFIRYGGFGDSSINFNVILRVTDYVSQYLIKHEFIKALHKRFKEEGIEIPFPQRDIHIKESFQKD